MTAKEKWIDELLGSMTLEQKIGQLMVFGFSGVSITPDVIDLVKNHHVGSLRISQVLRMFTIMNDVKPGEEPDEMMKQSMHAPKGLNRDFSLIKHTTVANAAEYAEILNEVRKIAFEFNGIPIHYTIDMEGNGSDDLLGGQRLFPHPMGIAATGDPEIAYKTGLSIGKQARAVGANMIHSPLIDVNSNPKNPEIGSRAYADNTEDVIKYATRTMHGLIDGGLVPTGKHFPGRGESVADAHFGLPMVDVDITKLKDIHIEPYIRLIKEGLPAIMSAHSVYPALGDKKMPASLSRNILTGFLRGELGFKGLITTDNMMMGGILKKYEMSEAIVQALIAGNDLVLTRDESPIRYKILDHVKEAVRQGRLPEKEVDDKVQRILGMKWDQGLAEKGGVVDPFWASAVTKDPEIIHAAEEAAEKSIIKLREQQDILPLRPDQKVLLVEQIFPSQMAQSNMYSHPGLLWEEMNKHSFNVGSIEINNLPTELDISRLKRRLDIDEYDVIVATNYYYHKSAAAVPEVIDLCMKTGKPVIVLTSTPYEVGAPKDYPTVLVFFQAGGRENMTALSRILFGLAEAKGQLPVQLP